MNYRGHRNSFTELGEVYFWTVTVNNWQPLLITDDYKLVVIESLQWLTWKGLVEIYGYVIMPNHVHLIWQQLQMNGNELPKHSFAKFTARQLLSKVGCCNTKSLNNYSVEKSDRKFQIWDRDPLAVLIRHKSMLNQKLEYIHANPLQAHWMLCETAVDYRFSSASFYEGFGDEFGILTHYGEVF